MTDGCWLACERFFVSCAYPEFQLLTQPAFGFFSVWFLVVILACLRTLLLLIIHVWPWLWLLTTPLSSVPMTTPAWSQLGPDLSLLLQFFPVGHILHQLCLQRVSSSCQLMGLTCSSTMSLPDLSETHLLARELPSWSSSREATIELVSRHIFYFVPCIFCHHL